jgi:hypothetical protein
LASGRAGIDADFVENWSAVSKQQKSFNQQEIVLVHLIELDCVKSGLALTP